MFVEGFFSVAGFALGLGADVVLWCRYNHSWVGNFWWVSSVCLGLLQGYLACMVCDGPM